MIVLSIELESASATTSFRGDVLTYIPASETSVTGLSNQPYFYVLNCYSEWFEIGASYIHDGRFRNVTSR